jgi:hypothetical protein
MFLHGQENFCRWNEGNMTSLKKQGVPVIYVISVMILILLGDDLRDLQLVAVELHASRAI